MNKCKFIALLITIFLCVEEGYSQFYPVQVSFFGKPPYPISLNEYANPQSRVLTLKVLLRDLTLGPTRVYFKFNISSNRVSYTNRMGSTSYPTFTLTPGVTTTFTQADFGSYFSALNLAVPFSNYINPLPEGVYTFSVEVIDALTNKALSGVTQAPPFWLVVNDPPILNLPLNNSSVKTTNPQNLIFQWTPRHRQANVVEYEFTLTELLVPDAFSGNLQNLFLSQPPYYQTTVSSTSFLYGPTLPPLIAGRLYGFRVRAKAKNGFEQVGLFRNEGYSEIFIFRYGEINRAPNLISAKWDYDGKALLTWSGIEQHAAFLVEQSTMNPFAQPNISQFVPNTPSLIRIGNNTFSAKLPLPTNTISKLRVGGVSSNSLNPTLFSNILLLTPLDWAKVIKGITKDDTDYLGLLSGKSNLKNPIPLLSSCDKPNVTPTNTKLNPVMLGDTLYAGGTLVQVISNESAKAIIKTPSGGTAAIKLYFSSDFKINQFNEVIEGYLTSEPTNHRIQLLSFESTTLQGDAISLELKRLGLVTDSLKTLANLRHDFSIAALQTGKVGQANNSIPIMKDLLSKKLIRLDEILNRIDFEIKNTDKPNYKNQLRSINDKIEAAKTKTIRNLDNLALFVENYRGYSLTQLRTLLPHLFLL